MSKKDDTVLCPHCGGEMKRNAKACLHCGSDDRTGWSDRTYLDEAGVPDEIDYEKAVADEFGEKPRRSHFDWKVIVGAIVLFGFLLAVMRPAC